MKVNEIASEPKTQLNRVNRLVPAAWLADWPQNVWLGTSVGDKANLPQLDLLRQIPAAVRLVSMEPLLEDLGEIDLDGIHWVIVGGESGANARPMHPSWARSIRDQCVAAGVKFFFKQWGEWAPDCLCGKPESCKTTPRQGGKMGLMFKCGKHAAGRLLDGCEWNEFPVGNLS